MVNFKKSFLFIKAKKKKKSGDRRSHLQIDEEATDSHLFCLASYSKRQPPVAYSLRKRRPAIASFS